MKELIFGFIGGTALLMYGVDKMGDGLEKASGEMMKKILSVLTGKVWSAFLVGTFLTALVQSSTAITVLAVGFVNAGLMKLPQAVGIIYGANIGTTITAQLMAFSFSFKLTDAALPVLGAGFLISYFAKNEKYKNIGDALMGFGMMFLGLKILNSGSSYMQKSAELKYFFEHYASIPIVGILLGIFATAVVHCSSATVALTMVLAQTGLIDLRAAVCIMLGDNIGTCISAQLASLTGNINARRTAWAHTLYNVFGVMLAGLTLPVFVIIVKWTTLRLMNTENIVQQIANAHTIFNVLSAVIFLPITKYYVHFLETFIRSRKDENESIESRLDGLLLDTPVAAFKASLSEIIRAAQIVKGMISNVFESLYMDNDKLLLKISSDEEIVNQIQKDTTLYIVDISKRPLSDSQSVMVPAMIRTINNIERIGDRAEDIAVLIKTKREKQLKFSYEAVNDMKSLQNLIMEMMNLTLKALEENNVDIVIKTAQIEGKIDELCKRISDEHVVRLEAGKCTIEAGVIYLDIINHFERIADYIYKISISTTDELKGVPIGAAKGIIEQL